MMPAETLPPPTAQPEPDPTTRPGQLPLPADGMGSLAYWQGEITAAQKQIEDRLPEWRENLARYQNKPLGKKPTQDTVWVPKDYALTERKRPQLWFKMPELYCVPKPGQSPQTAQAAPVFAAVLNQKMGPDAFDADTVMTEVTFDAICPAGLMVSALSYEATVDGTKPVKVGQQPTGRLIENPQNPMIAVPEMQDVFEDAPNIIYERYRWDRVSPAYLIASADWVGSKYDDGPYLGHRFEMDREIAKTRWELTDDDVPEGREPLKTLNEAEDKCADRRDRRVVTGVYLEYKTALYDPTVKHPQRLRELVLFDGAKSGPVIHRDSPHQTVTETGQLSGDSVLVFTTRVGSTRTISDGKFPNSDCQQSRPQVDELSKGRSQMVQQRNRAIPLRVGDKSRIDKDTQAKLKAGVYQEIILTDGDPKDFLHEVSQARFPRENFAFNDIIEKDLEETWALGSNQLGLEEEEGQTATEASLKQRNTDARLSKEQQNVKDYAMGCVRVAATLIQRYSDETDYVEVVGPIGAQILAQSALLTGQPVTPEQQQQAADPNTPTVVAWNKTMVQGTFLWTIKPDSQLRLDMTQERKYRTDVYNLMRRDALVNPQELVKWTLEGFGMSGPQFLAPPPPPQEPPPSISVSVKGEDLIPFAPQYANIVQMLTQDGKPPTFAAATVAPMAPSVPHGGPMPEPESLNKHLQDQTGKLPGPSGEQNTAEV